MAQQGHKHPCVPLYSSAAIIGADRLVTSMSQTTMEYGVEYRVLSPKSCFSLAYAKLKGYHGKAQACLQRSKKALTNFTMPVFIYTSIIRFRARNYALTNFIVYLYKLGSLIISYWLDLHTVSFPIWWLQVVRTSSGSISMLDPFHHKPHSNCILMLHYLSSGSMT